MAKGSSIEWCGPTLPWMTGCGRVDTDCDGCYAAGMALRLEAMALADLAAGRDPGRKRKYIGVATRTPSGRAAFNGTIQIDDTALDLPFAWKRPERIFVNSMSDVWHVNVPEDAIDRLFAMMALTPWHTYQILTKRPDRAAAYLTAPDRSARIEAARARRRWPAGDLPGLPLTLPLPNVWIGTSAGFQEAADQRIPELLRVPAAVRFLSLEPLIGPIDLGAVPAVDADAFQGPIGWVIAGGESGPKARPAKLAWFRSLRDQCQTAGVPFFMKQLGSVLSRQYGLPGKGGDWDDLPGDLRIREFPCEDRHG